MASKKCIFFLTDPPPRILGQIGLNVPEHTEMSLQQLKTQVEKQFLFVKSFFCYWNEAEEKPQEKGKKSMFDIKVDLANMVCVPCWLYLFNVGNSGERALELSIIYIH